MTKNRSAKQLAHRGKSSVLLWHEELTPVSISRSEWDSWHGPSPEKYPAYTLAIAILESALRAALRLAPTPGLHSDKREAYKKRYRSADQQSALAWLNSAALDHICEGISLEADYVRRLLRKALAKRRLRQPRASYTIHGATHK